MRTKIFLASILPLSLGMLLTACDNGTAPGSKADNAQVRADLQMLATRVTSFAAPMPGRSNSGLAKKSSAPLDTIDSISPIDTFFNPHCTNGLTIDAYSDTISGEVESSVDTSWNYDAAGALTCAGLAARTVSHSYFKNPKYESWANTVLLMSGSIYDSTLSFSADGKGRVHYFSDYTFTIDTMSMAMSQGKITKYNLHLGLQDGKYTVALAPAAGVDLTSDTQNPQAVILRGAILLNQETVGYFEVLGDENLVIRDAANAIVETH